VARLKELDLRNVHGAGPCGPKQARGGRGAAATVIRPPTLWSSTVPAPIRSDFVNRCESGLPAADMRFDWTGPTSALRSGGASTGRWQRPLVPRSRRLSQSDVASRCRPSTGSDRADTSCRRFTACGMSDRAASSDPYRTELKDLGDAEANELSE
jgi:hypothetical protein